jgi:hypothetical protein
LEWSATKLLNSCDEELRAKLEELIKPMEREYHTGPVLLKLMHTLITVTTPTAMRGMIDQLTGLSLSDFTGENVVEYTSVVRGVIDILKNGSVNGAMIPPDIVELIAAGLKKCSTVDFVDHIRTLMNADELGLHKVTPEVLLQRAELKFAALIGTNQWDASGEHNSAFVFMGKCYECGGQGHPARECPSKGKQGEDDAGRGRGNGRGRGGRGFGRGGRGSGRGGRGRGGRFAGRGDNAGRTSSNEGRGGGGGRGQLDRRQPQLDEPKKRYSDVKKMYEFWCGRCQHWTDHDTDKHRKMAEEAKLAASSDDATQRTSNVSPSTTQSAPVEQANSIRLRPRNFG